MAAITVESVFHNQQKLLVGSHAATVVNPLDVTIDVRGLQRIFVQLIVATAALTGFAIKAKPTADATVSTMYSTATDFTAPKGLLVGTSGDLTVQGVGTGWFVMDVQGLDAITLTATSAGSATLAVKLGGA